jgi:hypothetical protein
MPQNVASEVTYNNTRDKINPLNAQLNPICHLPALLGAHHILHFSRMRVKYPMFADNMANISHFSLHHF